MVSTHQEDAHDREMIPVLRMNINMKPTTNCRKHAHLKKKKDFSYHFADN